MENKLEPQGHRVGRPGGRERAVRPEARLALAEALTSLGAAPLRRDQLIEALHALNDRHGHLRTDHLAALAEALRLSQAEVFEVASFYHHFEIVREDGHGGFAAPPRLTVRVCDGLACELAGARELLGRLPAMLEAEVRVVAAPCLGRCEQAPAVAVHRHALAHATPEKVAQAVADGRIQAELPAAIGLDDYRAQGGYRLLQQCLGGERDVDGVIAELEGSGLRGLGGAGFPAGRKWRIVREQAAPRLLAVNIDEGEPGTFKDRWILERDPHRFVEGMLIAAWAVGIEKIFVYLRDEYHGLHALLRRELAALPALATELGLVLPEIELRRGAGAYVCGEESAMVESIEGRRGMPRLRPPYLAERGLFGRPTLAHNVETLHWVREIVERGGAWFAAQGRHGRRGLRRFSVSGRVREPGVKLAPAGITLRELVDEFCGGMAEGHALYAYLPGGASGGIFPASLADLPLDFDTLQPHGGFIGSAAVIVLSTQDRAVGAARNLIDFFEQESCGQCTPCRSGTTKLRQLIVAPRWDAALIGELAEVMRDGSICGLGQAAPNPVESVLRHFPQELEP